MFWLVTERGSADPKTNTELAHVIEQARRHNMPTEKIQQTLKASDVNKEELKSYLLEVKGPGGSFFLLDILTSNYTKTRQLIAALLKKNRYVQFHNMVSSPPFLT